MCVNDMLHALPHLLSAFDKLLLAVSFLTVEVSDFRLKLRNLAMVVFVELLYRFFVPALKI